MTTQFDGAVPESSSLLQKIGWTALAGFVAFSGSALFDQVLNISMADQLILTFVTGGVTLLVQYLADFERQLRLTQRQHRDVLSHLSGVISQGFAGVNEATALLDDIERSALTKDSVKGAIRTAGLFTVSTGALARAVADSEVERLSETLQALANGHELFYEGEDRELLLALTRKCTKSIMATSWATKSPHGMGFEAGFWLNDLGGRYLMLQRMALRRGVSIKRVFIYETPDLIESEAIQRILAMQQSAGIEVRTVAGGLVSPDGSIADFIVFDEQISYETTPVTRGETSTAPWLLTTRLVMEEETVRSRVVRYHELWEQAAQPGR
jgi:hypothetical protein